uniref:Glycoside hydrolase n=1 Tax=viral metagenome TaxID=1070528 RepID=A0A6M3M8G8_9ZZZZ
MDAASPPHNFYLPLAWGGNPPDPRYVAWLAPQAELASVGLKPYNTIVSFYGINSCPDCETISISLYTNCVVVSAWAGEHPGHTFIIGDEPDQLQWSAAAYRAWYDDCVLKIKLADHTANVSLAGIAQPNSVYNPDGHSLDYLDAVLGADTEPLYTDYLRVHAFPPQDGGEIDGWISYLEVWLDWRDENMPGTPIVLGTFGYPSGAENETIRLRALEMLDWLEDSEFIGWCWWEWGPRTGQTNELFKNSALMPMGEVYWGRSTD